MCLLLSLLLNSHSDTNFWYAILTNEHSPFEKEETEEDDDDDDEEEDDNDDDDDVTYLS